jgi:predicted phage tail protein
VNLSWPAATDNIGVSSYRVSRDGTLLQSGLTSTSAIDSTATDVTSYDYTVQALDAAGNVSAASPITTVVTPDWTPPTAARLTAATGTSGTIRLSWSGATDNVRVSSYSVYRDGVRVATGITASSWVDSGMTAGPHHYYVLAVDAAGHSSPASNTATANSTAALTTAYIASSRQGGAVYINGLIKQQTGSTIARSPGRTVYLQRFINGGWQTMLARTSNATGQISVGFIQNHAYNYRLYVIASTTATAATSASSIR